MSATARCGALLSSAQRPLRLRLQLQPQLFLGGAQRRVLKMHRFTRRRVGLGNDTGSRRVLQSVRADAGKPNALIRATAFSASARLA